jgi:hypothetical protein
MKASKLDEIKKELEKVIEFREGTGILKGSFFGEYQGYTVSLTYEEDYSSIFIGRLEGLNLDLAINFDECRVKVEHGQVLFIGTESSVSIGEWRND